MSKDSRNELWKTYVFTTNTCVHDHIPIISVHATENMASHKNRSICLINVKKCVMIVMACQKSISRNWNQSRQLVEPYYLLELIHQPLLLLRVGSWAQGNGSPDGAANHRYKSNAQQKPRRTAMVAAMTGGQEHATIIVVTNRWQTTGTKKVCLVATLNYPKGSKGNVSPSQCFSARPSEIKRLWTSKPLWHPFCLSVRDYSNRNRLHQ